MTRSPEREEFLADILTTAVEGGVNYWAYADAYIHTPSKDAAVLLEEAEEDECPHYVDIDSIAKGIALYLEHLRPQNEYRKRIAEANRDNDAGELDAEDADVIVQFAIFGEIKYG